MSAKRLTDKELAKYEKILLKEKEETLKILQKIDDIQRKGSKNRPGDLSSYSLHQADLGTDTDESEKRVFYIGPMFRGEKPAAGRRRQFHQIGVENVGKSAPELDDRWRNK